ncbi:MAG TPA: hypothetical protein VMS64_14305 [Candidatus Methylomirabilis sp.]|nr:hypothetical protein [Candidatus Methylomirabilis sp.]
MVTVTGEILLPCSPEEAWVALGRRSMYLRFPGVTRGTKASHPLHLTLDLPIVDRVEQHATLSVGRAPRTGRRERRFALRGPLVDIAGRWQLEPCDEGVRLRVTLGYEIAAALKEHAVNTLRSRSPLPIRTDADAILSRAVDEFFETRLAEQAAACCDAVRAHLAGLPA